MLIGTTCTALQHWSELQARDVFWMWLH